MEKDKKRIIVGAGILFGSLLAFLLQKRAGGGPGEPGEEEPIAKGTINGYEVWLLHMKPEVLSDLKYHEFSAPTSIRVYFKVMKSPYIEPLSITDESQMPVATLALTRPDGVVTEVTKRIPEINHEGEYSMYVGANLPGVYSVNFCDITFSFKLLPIENEIFHPTGLELIYDAAPYCQELLDSGRVKPTVVGGHGITNLEAIANRMVDLNIASIDFKIGGFFDDEEAAKFDLTIAGNVKGQADIFCEVLLIPQVLYAQAYLAESNAPNYLPMYWSYPDPNLETIYTHGATITTGAGDFIKRNLSRWTREVRNPRKPGGKETSHDPAEIRKYLNHGDRLEVVIDAWTNLPSQHEYGMNYPLKTWHVGYVIVD